MRNRAFKEVLKVENIKHFDSVLFYCNKKAQMVDVVDAQREGYAGNNRIALELVNEMPIEAAWVSDND